jgi:maltose-binding protein MalE
LIQYLNTEENQYRFAKWGGSSTRRSVLNNPELVAERPIYGALADVHDMAYVQAQVPELAYIWDIQAEPLADVITGEKSVKQALDDAVQKVYDIMKKAGYYEGKSPPPTIPKP